MYGMRNMTYHMYLSISVRGRLLLLSTVMAGVHIGHILLRTTKEEVAILIITGMMMMRSLNEERRREKKEKTPKEREEILSVSL